MGPHGRPCSAAIRSAAVESRSNDASTFDDQVSIVRLVLNRSSLVPSRSTAREDHIARMERGARRLARTVPDLAAEVGARLRRLSDRATDLPDPRRVPIHGSPHEHQWLVDGDGDLATIDAILARR